MLRSSQKEKVLGLLRSIKDRAMIRLHGRDEYESTKLRDYFRRTYGIDIGMYTFGAFDRWRVPPGTKIGRYCSIARNARFLDGNHPIHTLSSHPYFYERHLGLTDRETVTIRPQVVEDDVWIGHNVTIGATCHQIGRGSVIGAGAVVTHDVPRYAIILGMPGKVVRYRFDPETIAAIESTKWWTLDKEQLKAAMKAAPDFAFNPSPATVGPFLKAIGR